MRIAKKDFIKILSENAGLFARTARAIQKKYGVEMSRQAVRKRALKYPEILEEIREANLDFAEETLFNLQRDSNSGVKLKAAEFYLRNQGRSRNYGDSLDVNIDFEKMTDQQLEAIVNSLAQKVKP